MDQKPNVPIDWQWVETGFCLFVIFHLLPSFIVTSSFSSYDLNAFTVALWTFIALAPIGYFIGYRSTGVTILEPGLASLFYTIVLLFGLLKLQNTAFTFATLTNSLIWMFAAFLVAVVSAWVGEKVQARNKGKTAG
ncbi:MAG: hypothetical protein WEB33_12065 [Bacteroidota bacterium]